MIYTLTYIYLRHTVSNIFFINVSRHIRSISCFISICCNTVSLVGLLCGDLKVYVPSGFRINSILIPRNIPNLLAMSSDKFLCIAYPYDKYIHRIYTQLCRYVFLKNSPQSRTLYVIYLIFYFNIHIWPN